MNAKTASLVPSAPLEFDPDTAHTRLLLSSDGRSARGVQYTINRPDNPRRYDVAIAVVTKTGFTSGKPYWEIQVKDRPCFVVGVASQLAPRKGSILYSPTNGYWTIQKKNGQHYVQTEIPAPLPLVSKLDTIGILIDFSKGEVIFNNALTGSVIFTFRGYVFTQKLYPFVATCGNESLGDWPIELSDTGLASWLNG